MVPLFRSGFLKRNIYKSLFRCTTLSAPNRRSFCEEAKAKKTAAIDRTKSTIFDKILSKELPADIIFEDDKCLAFNDVAPQAPVHFLIIPKYRIQTLATTTLEDTEMLGHLMRIAGELGNARAPEGFQLVVNNGIHGCQSVYHLHLHILGGRQLKWPPG